MGANTAIEWAHHTFNPWMGCAKVSTGCKHCYAETLMDTRWGKVEWGVNGTRVVTSDANWRKPIQWDKAAKAAGERHRVFCASLADVFEDREDLRAPRLRLFDLIRKTPNLDWLLLTKRPENVVHHLEQARLDVWDLPEHDDLRTQIWLEEWKDYLNPPHNVWIGTSVENQEAADTRIYELLRVPALVRFLSMEPLLGPVDLGKYLLDPYFEGRAACRGVHWVIAGGESGPGARPMHPDWARSLRDQCQKAEVPFFFKQWGEWTAGGAGTPDVPDGSIGPGQCRWLAPDGSTERIGLGRKGRGDVVVLRVGKKAGGRVLDGRTWDEVPTPTEVQA